MTLELDQARRIIGAALKRGLEMKLRPLTVAVLDASGAVVALERSDGASRMRPQIATGKANGAIALGMGSRAIFRRAEEQPFFIQSMNALAGGVLVPVPGGVLIRDASGGIVGAVGITGDSSDNDETCAIAGIEVIGLVADPG